MFGKHLDLYILLYYYVVVFVHKCNLNDYGNDIKLENAEWRTNWYLSPNTFFAFLSFNIDFEMIIVTEHSFENIYVLRKFKRYQSGNQNKIRNSKKFRKCNDRNKRDNLKNTAWILLNKSRNLSEQGTLA